MPAHNNQLPNAHFKKDWQVRRRRDATPSARGRNKPSLNLPRDGNRTAEDAVGRPSGAGHPAGPSAGPSASRGRGNGSCSGRGGTGHDPGRYGLCRHDYGREGF